jgi:hypothetical protein
MPDTSPEIERLFRQMVLQRSGAERMRMGASMFSTARVVAIASLRAREPSMSEPALRRALFLRFYGVDFDPEERERIAARLGGDAGVSKRPGRKIPVNWDDLEVALTTNEAEWSCYLELRTGEVQMVPLDRLAVGGDWPSEEQLDAALDAGHLIPVEPLGSSVEYGWMEEFTASVQDRRLRNGLESALDGRRPFRRFKDILLEAPAERERWFAFRDERLRAAAREWLAEQGIEPTTLPPDRHA